MTSADVMERIVAAMQSRHPARRVQTAVERTPIAGVTVWTAEVVVRNADTSALVAIHVGRASYRSDAAETLAKSLGVDITEEVAR